MPWNTILALCISFCCLWIGCDGTSFSSTNFLFTPRYIRIVGTHNTVNKIFHIVAFECMFTNKTFTLEKGLIGEYCNYIFLYVLRYFVFINFASSLTYLNPPLNQLWLRTGWFECFMAEWHRGSLLFLEVAKIIILVNIKEKTINITLGVKNWKCPSDTFRFAICGCGMLMIVQQSLLYQRLFYI